MNLFDHAWAWIDTYDLVRRSVRRAHARLEGKQKLTQTMRFSNALARFRILGFGFGIKLYPNQPRELTFPSLKRRTGSECRLAISRKDRSVSVFFLSSFMASPSMLELGKQKREGCAGGGITIENRCEIIP